MENQGHTPSEGNDSSLCGQLVNSFKLPLNYSKIKRQLVEASDFSFLLSKLNQLSSSADSSDNFCKGLLKLEGFESFRTVHLFKHEKGQSIAFKMEVNDQRSSLTELHVNEFNQLFQGIKKSKNRTFGQETMRGFDFGILGTFLAREFSLGSHNIILAVSRNDFLSQTKGEKKAFDNLVKVIGPYLDIILERELQNKQYHDSQLAFENLPYKVEINDNFRPGYHPLKSKRFYKVHVEESIDRADIFHQERIALLGELLNTLKHELSNPLFGLQLSADLLVGELEDEESIMFMREISSSIKRSQSIISNFTQLYTSSEKISSKELEKMINEVFTLTKSQSRHINKTLEFESPDNEVEYTLEANSVWLAQIIFNLVINSAQALNQYNVQNPHIRIKAKLSSPFELHFQDNGPGIDSKSSENIFKPFYTTKEKGTGLGLAISKSLANKLNGELSLIDQGQGAHFILRLNS